MKKRKSTRWTFIAHLTLTLVTSFGLVVPSISAQAQQKIPLKRPYAFTGSGASLMFLENIGQFDAKARFVARGDNAVLYATEEALWFTILEPLQPVTSGKALGRTPTSRSHSPVYGPQRGVNLKLSFVGTSSYSSLEPFNRRDTKVSSFIGNDPGKWQTYVPVWGGVRYVNLYPGIDLEISSKGGKLVQRLVLHSEQAVRDSDAALQDVRLRVEGTEYLTLDGNRLRMATALGEFTLPLLQVVDSKGAPLDWAGATPIVKGKDIVAPFSSAALSANPLVSLFASAFALLAENPSVRSQQSADDLLYSTFLGGSDWDSGYGIAVDGSGYIYVTGMTQSADFPSTTGAFEESYQDGGDIYVVKLNPAGNEQSDLVYATFLGGNGYDFGSAIAVDSAGNAYVTGDTDSTNFPQASKGYDTSYGGGYSDAFMVKVNATGTQLLYATYLGGSESEYGRAIAVDGTGNAYVVGNTSSSDFPSKIGSYDIDYNGGYGDAFVVKLNPASSGASSLLYATYLGGSTDVDDGMGIAVDASGNIYVTGETESGDFPTTSNAFQASYNGGSKDAFVAKLNPAGNGSDDLVYATYLGGSDWDAGQAIAVKGSNAYVVGWTSSNNFFTTPGAFDSDIQGSQDAFVVKVNADGTDLDYGTLLGGSGNDKAYSIALDADGYAYVAGETRSIDFSTPGGYDTELSGTGDAFAAKINLDGTQLIYATYLGGSSNYEYAIGIAADGVGNAYVTGQTESFDFPTTQGAYDPSYGDGWGDAFVVKLAMQETVPPPPPTPDPTPPPISLDPPPLHPINNPGGSNTYLVSWDTVSGAAYFELEEDDNDQFSSPVLRYSDSELEWRASNKPVGTYYYRARSCNTSGCGEWSEPPYPSTSVCSRPGDTLLQSPDNDTRFYQDKPKLFWEEAIDADAGYQIIVYSNSYTDPECDERHNDSIPPAEGYDIGCHLDDGLWYWRIRGVNACGGTGSWSVPRYFRYYNTGLGTPSLNVQEAYNQESYTVYWTGVGGANVVYELRMAHQGEPEELVYRGTSYSFPVENRGTGLFDFSLKACYDDNGSSVLCGDPDTRSGIVVLAEPQVSIQDVSSDGKSYKVYRDEVEGADQYTLRMDNPATGQFNLVVDMNEPNYYQETDKSPGTYHYQAAACKGSKCRFSAIEEFTVLGGNLSNEPYEAVWLWQTQTSAPDQLFDVVPGQIVNVTIALQNLGTATWTKVLGYGQVILATNKTPNRISAPTWTGYDDCFDGTPSPNCGQSYFHDVSWIDDYKAATFIENTISQGDTATFDVTFQVPLGAEPGQFIEGFTLYVNLGTASNPDWQPVPNTTNGENGTTFVWIGFDIDPSLSPVVLDWDHQDFGGDNNPIPVPQMGEYPNVGVWFDSVGFVHPERANLQLCLRKDRSGNPPASSPPDDDSYFRHANWIYFNQQVEGEWVNWCVPGPPTGSGTNYEFSVDFSDNNPPDGTCNLGPGGAYCREDFGIVYNDNGTYKWVRSNRGRVMPDGRVHTNTWWHLQVEPEYQAKWIMQTQDVRIPALETYEVTIVVENTGTATWTNSGPDRVVLAVRKYTDPPGPPYPGGSTPCPYDEGSSVFMDDSWLNHYHAAMMEESQVDPGEQATFRVTLRAPALPGKYQEDFGLALASGSPWFKNPHNGHDGDLRVWMPIEVESPRLEEAVMVLAAHPADEALGAAGVVNQAQSEGRRVVVGIATHGDARDPNDHQASKTYGLTRQKESITGLTSLGVISQQVVSLGYPDGHCTDCGLSQVAATQAPDAYESDYTGQQETYGVYTTTHPYNQQSIVADISSLLRAYKPTVIYLPHEQDEHPNRSQLYSLVLEALETAGISTAYEMRRYLITAPSQGTDWPGDSSTFPQPLNISETPERIALSSADKANKSATIAAHQTQFDNGLGPFLEKFVKDEEIYWPVADTMPPKGKYTTPGEGEPVGDSLTLKADVSDVGGSGIERVEMTALYNGTWHTLAVINSTGPYVHTWDLANIPDQDIWLGLDMYDNAGNYGNLLRPMGIRKDTSGYKAKHAEQTQPSGGIFVMRPGQKLAMTVEYTNTGDTVWQQAGDDFVALYADNPPTQDCQPGPDSNNGFFAFRYPNGQFHSTPEHPDTGIAKLNQASLAPGERGTFTVEIQAPYNIREGFYPVYLSPAHSDQWILSSERATHCDFHARARFDILVVRPQPRIRRYVADPVNVTAGNFYHKDEDMRIQGRGLPLVFERTYNSFITNTASLTESGFLSSGWTHNHNIFLALNQEAGTAMVQHGDGHRDVFFKQPDGSFKAEVGVYDLLNQNSSDGYSLLRKDQTCYKFSANGQLEQIVDRHGNTLSFSYSEGRLAQVTDAAGRSLTFIYLNDRLSRVNDPLGRHLDLHYDAEGRLAQVDDLRGKPTTYTYDASGRLATITDANGHTFVENHYDGEGRVVWQRSVDNVTTFQYLTDQNKTMMTDGRNYDWVYTYDDHLRLLEERNPLNQSMFYTYDEEDNLSSVQDRRGHTTLYEHEQGNLTQIVDAEGGITQHTYNLTNDRTSTTDAENRLSTFTYDNGNLVRIDAPESAITRFTYDQYGQRLSMTDPNNHTTYYEYDEYGYFQAITNTLGYTTRLVHDVAGRKLEETDARGYTTRYTYDDANNLLEIQDPYGNTTAYTYDDASNQKSITDAEGHTTLYDYDAKDRLVTITDAQGKQVHYTYDPNDNRTSVINFAGEETSYVYDGANCLVEEQNALGHKITYEYDGNNNRTSVTDANNHTTMYIYDKLDRLIELIDPLEQHTRYTYDKVGNQTQVTDNAGNATIYEHDGLDRLIRVVDAEGGIVEYQYDNAGNMIQVKDANGHATTYQYDEAHQLCFVTDPAGNITEHRYDKVGNRAWQRDANGVITTYDYDRLNHLVKISYPGQVVQRTYDKVGNLKEMIDSSGTTLQEHDALNRVVRVTTAEGTILYSYDPMGRRKQITYPNGQTAIYTYDLTGRLVEVQDWVGGTTYYEYDPAGNLKSVSRPNGTHSEYIYDEANQVTSIIHTASGDALIAAFSYTYDLVGNRDSVTEWVASAAMAAQTALVHFNSGWNSVSLPLSPTLEVTAGDLCSQVVPQDHVDQVVRRHNDQWNAHVCGVPANDFSLGLEQGYFIRSSEVATWTVSGLPLSAATRVIAFQVGWNLVAPASDAIDKAEVLCQAIGDLGGEAAEVVRWHNDQWNSHPCGVLANDFDLEQGQAYFVRVTAVGEPLILPETGETDNSPIIDGTITYEYDDLYRLVQVAYPDGEIENYAYDTMGNRKSLSDENGTINYAYDDADRLLSTGPASFTWDNNGNMTSRTQGGATVNYSYDAANHLQSAGNVSFTYDGAGRRLSKTAGGDTIRYINDVALPLHQVLVERTPGGDILYLYGLDRIARFAPDGKAAYYHGDALGSVRALSDESGELIASYAYDAFGAVRAASGSPGAFGFTGEQVDSETGFTYLRERYYDPLLGRFTTRDRFPGRASDTQSLNRYVYVQNNPVNNVDPSGREKHKRGIKRYSGVTLLPETGADIDNISVNATPYPPPIPVLAPTPTGYVYTPSEIDWGSIARGIRQVSPDWVSLPGVPDLGDAVQLVSENAILVPALAPFAPEIALGTSILLTVGTVYNTVYDTVTDDRDSPLNLRHYFPDQVPEYEGIQEYPPVFPLPDPPQQ